jgi:hypothetical protein
MKRTILNKAMERTILLTLLAASVATSTGCPPPPPKPPREVYTPKFDWEPPSKAVPGSAHVTFAIVSPEFSARASSAWAGADGTPPVLRDLQQAMSGDFAELLAAKGFTTRGPFATYMEMTFPDKKGSDLVLHSDIDITIHDAGRAADFHVVLLGPNQFTFHGVAELGGRVQLVLSESLTNERMWVKTVELPSKKVAWIGTEALVNPSNPNAVVIPLPPFYQHFADPGFLSTVGRELEAYYRFTMDAAWRYLSPEEMSLVKKQAQEIRQRKVY